MATKEIKPNKARVIILSPLHQMPVRPLGIHGEALREWKRVAKRLFSMGRLQINFGRSLQAYCFAVADFLQAREEIESKGLKADTIAKKLLGPAYQNCRLWALEFGFPVDADGRMILSKPISFTSAWKRAHPKPRRRRAANLPDWLEPPTFFDDHMQEVWNSTAVELLAKGRLRPQDKDQLQSYAYHLGSFRYDRLYIQRTRRFEKLTGRDEAKLIVYLKKSARVHWEQAKRSAVALGFFLQSPPKPK